MVERARSRRGPRAFVMVLGRPVVTQGYQGHAGGESPCNPRLFGPLHEKSPEWRAVCQLQQSVERVFKGIKEGRGLERHRVRGFGRSACMRPCPRLAFTATVPVQTLGGRPRVGRRCGCSSSVYTPPHFPNGCHVLCPRTYNPD